MLVKHTTEYAYLFSKVMDGVTDGLDHDRLFLLPNAARRVLEVFSSTGHLISEPSISAWKTSWEAT